MCSYFVVRKLTVSRGEAANKPVNDQMNKELLLMTWCEEKLARMGTVSCFRLGVPGRHASYLKSKKCSQQREKHGETPWRLMSQRQLYTHSNSFPTTLHTKCRAHVQNLILCTGNESVRQETGTRNCQGQRVNILFLNVYLFLQREKVGQEQREREGDRGSEAGSVLTAGSPTQGLELTNGKIAT